MLVASSIRSFYGLLPTSLIGYFGAVCSFVAKEIGYEHSNVWIGKDFSGFCHALIESPPFVDHYHSMQRSLGVKVRSDVPIVLSRSLDGVVAWACFGH